MRLIRTTSLLAILLLAAEMSPRFQLQAQSNKTVAIYGAVQRPGEFPYRPEMTLRQYIAVAGGLSPEALSAKSVLLRFDQRQQIWEMRRLDIKALLKGEEDDHALQPGDIIIVAKKPERPSDSQISAPPLPGR